jgi:hypothetical protein
MRLLHLPSLHKDLVLSVLLHPLSINFTINRRGKFCNAALDAKKNKKKSEKVRKKA